MCASKVDHKFVGEVESYLLCQTLCGGTLALHAKSVDEIDPMILLLLFGRKWLLFARIIEVQQTKRGYLLKLRRTAIDILWNRAKKKERDIFFWFLNFYWGWGESDQNVERMPSPLKQHQKSLWEDSRVALFMWMCWLRLQFWLKFNFYGLICYDCN